MTWCSLATHTALPNTLSHHSHPYPSPTLPHNRHCSSS